MMIIPQNRISGLSKAETGGKASNLAEMAGLGLNVPRFIVLSAEFLLQQIPASLIETKDNSSINTVIKSVIFTEEFLEDIRTHFPGAETFAVRSSAVDEDGSEFSFAGQFDSFLDVPYSQLSEKIKAVWQSNFSERAGSYRKNNGLPFQPKIAVIVQQMVKADCAGVAFGINPVTGHAEEVLINAVAGTGEKLVSGEVSGDSYLLKNGLLIEEIPAGETPVLDEKKFTKVYEAVKQLELHYKKPQDVEFAFAGDELFLLQTRPVTGLKETETSPRIVWDNSNIIESYPGLTLPLTFSFIINVYEQAYKQLLHLLGASKEDINANATVFANTLGLLRGRVYYNLFSWYKMLSLLPGYALNKEFMEKMMGVKESFELPGEKKMGRREAWLGLGTAVIRIMRNLMRLDKQRKKFVQEFHLELERFNAIDLTQKSSQELMELFLDFEREIIGKWKAPLVNDFFTMIFFGVLQKMLQNMEEAGHENLHNDLMIGSRDIISVEPARRIVELVEMIRADAATMEIFQQEDEQEILERIKLSDSGFSKAFFRYLHDFGHRCSGELKLETVTYAQQPEKLINLLKAKLNSPVYESRSGSNEEISEIRKVAEEKALKFYSGKAVKKWLFKLVLRKSRELVSNRENLRYERTKAFAVARAVFVQIGHNFKKMNFLEQHRDIFYLRKEEIFNYIKGTSTQVDLKSLVKLRKEEYEIFKAEPALPDRITTYGTVYRAENFTNEEQMATADGDLSGIGCCPGIVRAKISVIMDSGEVASLQGNILVTSSTDPGWVPLFPSASGIIVERGSLLSHSAIVAREMGIPCIVGVKGLLRQLKNGDEVEMNGSTGQIKILNKA